MTHSEQEPNGEVIRLVRELQEIPYEWPSPPDADHVRTNGAGSCASKHALLAEELGGLGVASAPLFVVGPLVPPLLENDPLFEADASLLEVHELLTVMTPWAGPLRVDITWDPPLIERGLPGTLDWDGESDMAIAVGEGSPSWSPPRDGLRAAKEALRKRIYGPGQREVRDEILARLSARFAEWRRG